MAGKVVLIAVAFLVALSPTGSATLSDGTGYCVDRARKVCLGGGVQDDAGLWVAVSWVGSQASEKAPEPHEAPQDFEDRGERIVAEVDRHAQARADAARPPKRDVTAPTAPGRPSPSLGTLSVPRDGAPPIPAAPEAALPRPRTGDETVAPETRTADLRAPTVPRLGASKGMPTEGGAPRMVVRLREASLVPQAPGAALDERAWREGAQGAAHTGGNLQVASTSGLASFAPRAWTPSPLSAYALLFGVFVVGSFLLLPYILLYRRLERPDVVDSKRRQRLLEHVVAHPGVTTADVARAFDLHYTTARHHLDLLVRFGCLTLRESPGSIHYFENHGRFSREEKTHLVTALREENVACLRLVARHPGVTQKEMRARLGLAKSTISRRVRKLAEQGLLSREGNGFRLTSEGAKVLIAGALA